MTLRLAIRTESGSEWHFRDARYRRIAFMERHQPRSIDEALSYDTWHTFRRAEVETLAADCWVRLWPADRPTTSLGIVTGPIVAVSID